MSKQNFAKAQYCYEEILALQPCNCIVNLKFAELLYSQAADDVDNLYLSRKYYSHALTLMQDDSNLLPRALWGLLNTCKQIEASLKKDEEKNAEVIRTC